MTVRVPTVPDSLWANPSSERGNVQGNGGDTSVPVSSATTLPHVAAPGAGGFRNDDQTACLLHACKHRLLIPGFGGAEIDNFHRGR